MRNLARLHAAGIPCPKPLQLRLHVLGEVASAVRPWPAGRSRLMQGPHAGLPGQAAVACAWSYCRASPPIHSSLGNRNGQLSSTLTPTPPPVHAVMEFLGEGGVAAPRLKDAGLPPPRMRQAYTEMILMLRALYQKCRLVHADLSGEALLPAVPGGSWPGPCWNPCNTWGRLALPCAALALASPASRTPTLTGHSSTFRAVPHGLSRCLYRRIQRVGAQQRAVLHRCQPGGGAGPPPRL